MPKTVKFKRVGRDTSYTTKYEDFIVAAKKCGFDLLLEEGFTYNHLEEKAAVLWHKCGVLVFADTCFGLLNRLEGWFNLKLNPDIDAPEAPAARGETWAANIEGTDEFFGRLQHLQELGTFLPAWEQRPWSLNLAEHIHGWRSADSASDAREARLPASIRSAIGSV